LDDLNTTLVSGTCAGGEDACAKVGGSVIKVTDDFVAEGREQRTSILGHEGGHLAGSRKEYNRKGILGGFKVGAQSLECAIFQELCMPLEQPDSPYL
jgi:hypothetical protein